MILDRKESQVYLDHRVSKGKEAILVYQDHLVLQEQMAPQDCPALRGLLDQRASRVWKVLWAYKGLWVQWDHQGPREKPRHIHQS